MRTVRGTWRRDAERSEDEAIRLLGNIGLLVLDEVGVQSGTENEQNILFDVLDRRYSHCKPTILLTNFASKEFRECIGERLFDRMKEIAVWVPFKWDSYRGLARE
ncbi:DNA replication protein DnaC [compost metagenome]